MQVNLINENVKSKYKQLLKIKKLIIDTKITEKENMDLIKQELKSKLVSQGFIKEKGSLKNDVVIEAITKYSISDKKELEDTLNYNEELTKIENKYSNFILYFNTLKSILEENKDFEQVIKKFEEIQNTKKEFNEEQKNIKQCVPEKPLVQDDSMEFEKDVLKTIDKVATEESKFYQKEKEDEYKKKNGQDVKSKEDTSGSDMELFEQIESIVK